MSQYAGFNSVQLRKPQRSNFDLSHEKRLSTRMGKLTPVFISETLPNDTFYGNIETMVRVAPMLAPIMHLVNVTVHIFFVPNRILADWWEPFITGGRLGTEITSPPVPSCINIGQILGEGEDYLDTGSLADYLGMINIPDADVAAWNNRLLDMLPFAVYQKCIEDWYRDRNYTADTTAFPLASGEVDTHLNYLMQMHYRCWEHDYFTSALPFTQRGAEVLMPLEGSGFVTYKSPTIIDKVVGGNLTPGDLNVADPNPTDPLRDAGGASVIVDNIDEVILDASSVSINDLRQANALQVWMERNALAGSRYNESIMAHFARRTSDARLQRAEYLGGGKVSLKISEVLTTAYSVDADATNVPPGNMAGHGKTFGNTNSFSYNCEEHGFIIGIMSVMPTSSYMQGIPRMFLSRNTFLDYPWPTFAHLGEQEVHKYEIFANPTNVPVDRTTQPLFGYQSRYADWKFISSSSHGDFRTNLDFWHLTRKFASSPTLGEEFVTFEDELQDRIFAVADVDTLWCYIYNSVKVKRSLPYFGTPML